MELKKYYTLLYNNRFVLLAAPVLAVLVAFFLTHKTPDSYLAETDLSTGIIDPTQQVMANTETMAQESRVNQQFANLLETIKLGKVVDQVSYSLMIHDLTSDQPFRPKSKLLQQLNASARAHALWVFKDKYNSRQPLNLTVPDDIGLKSVLDAQKYDAESIKKQLTIYRTESSDFVHLEFLSEQPQLSAFVLNTLCQEFISYTTADQQKNKVYSTEFLQKLLEQKQDTMNAKIAALKNYKIRNRILDLKDESTSLYTQLTAYRDKKAQAEKDILSYNSAIADINSRFDPHDRKYLEASTIKINGEVAQTRDRLVLLNSKYIQSNFDLRYKRSIDSLQSRLDEQIGLMSDKYVTNPLAGKESLVQEKIKMEISRAMARSGLLNLDKQISQLNNQIDRIVPYDAAIQSYDRDIDVAAKEYVDVQNKYNQSSIESNLKGSIKQVESAMPGTRQPSKKLLLTLASGVITFMVCLLVFFIIFYLDRNIRVPTDLANAAQVPVLGQLDLIVQSTIDYRRIGNKKQSSEELMKFKNMLRSIRFEIDNELQDCIDGRVIAVTSMNESEGKSLICMSLASVYAMANKKVLVVDGNFDNPSLTDAAYQKVYLEDFLNDEECGIDSPDNSLISLLGNQGGDNSLLEKNTETVIRKKIDQLKRNFDVIIIETQALSLMNKAKEWIQFSDKVIAVFEANQTINQDKKLYINYLRTLNTKFIGLIMNKVSVNSALEVQA